MNEKKELLRAEEFHEMVGVFFSFYFSTQYTLVEFCAGNGNGGKVFSLDHKVEEIIFVDIKRTRGLERNTSKITKPYECHFVGIENYKVEPGDFAMISIHACGNLTDLVLEKAFSIRAPIAVMPCCYNDNMKKYDLQNPPERKKLLYKREEDYYDAFRLRFLEENAYRVWIKTINPKITPMNNIIIGLPSGKFSGLRPIQF